MSEPEQCHLICDSVAFVGVRESLKVGDSSRHIAAVRVVADLGIVNILALCKTFLQAQSSTTTNFPD